MKFSVALLALLLASPIASRAADAPFLRADSNVDGDVDISDAIFTLNWLFRAEANPGCADAADANDDGVIDISDATWTVWYLFLGAAAPPAPFEVCGRDPTPDGLDCAEHFFCPPGSELIDFDELVLSVFQDSLDDEPRELNALEICPVDDPQSFDGLLCI